MKSKVFGGGAGFHLGSVESEGGADAPEDAQGADHQQQLHATHLALRVREPTTHGVEPATEDDEREGAHQRSGCTEAQG